MAPSGRARVSQPSLLRPRSREGASKQEKGGPEKRGRGRPCKRPPKERSAVPTPETSGPTKEAQKRCCQDPEKPPRRHGDDQEAGPKTLEEEEEEEGVSQESSEGRPWPRRLLPHRAAVSSWDRTAPLALPTPRPPGHHPPAPSTPHCTAHQLLQGPGGLSGEQFSFGLGSRQPLTHRHTLALLDRANLPLSCTVCPLRPRSLSGRDIADWAPGLGTPSPLLFPLVPSKGPRRAPLALKGPHAPFTLTRPLH